MALSVNVQTDLSRLNAELSAVFAEVQLTTQQNAQIRLVQEFYHNELTNSSSGDTNQPLMKQYNNLVDTLKLVKASELSLEAAEQVIEASTYDRKILAVVHNLLKTCALLFWLAASLNCYFVCIAVGIPLISFQPVLGTLLTAGTFFSAGVSLNKANTCIDEFKSFELIDREDRRERTLFQFFNPLPGPNSSPVVESLYPNLVTAAQ